MASAAHIQTRDPRSRYDGGFDRWDRNSRLGWSVIWRASEHTEFAMGEHQSVWVWDEREQIWASLAAEEQVVIRREHQLTLKHLRRALPVLRLFLDGSIGHEQEAARAALKRIGAAIAEVWQQGKVADHLRRGQGWIDHPAALYQAITRDCRHHFEPAVDMTFDPQVFAALVAQAEEDFRAGLREHPPRLRARDLASLQGAIRPAAAPMEEPEIVAEPRADLPENEIPENFGPQGGFNVDQLRQDLHAELASTDVASEAKDRRRRIMMVASGVLAACLGLFVVMGGFG